MPAREMAGVPISRRRNRLVSVQCDDKGIPAHILAGRTNLPVYSIVDDWCEWFGVLFGEQERDVWLVDTPRGIYELHCLHDGAKRVGAIAYNQNALRVTGTTEKRGDGINLLAEQALSVN